MANQQVIRIPAKQIQYLLQEARGSWWDVCELAAELKQRHGGPLHVRLDFPGEPDGGVELRVNRGTWFGWLLWGLAGKPLRLWRE